MTALTCESVCANIDAAQLIIDELIAAECKGTDITEGGVTKTRSVRYRAAQANLDRWLDMYMKLGCASDHAEYRQEVMVSKPCCTDSRRRGCDGLL